MENTKYKQLLSIFRAFTPQIVWTIQCNKIDKCDKLLTDRNYWRSIFLEWITNSKNYNYNQGEAESTFNDIFEVFMVDFLPTAAKLSKNR